MARKKTSVSAVNTKPYFIIDNERLFKARTAGIQDVNKETEDLLNGTVYTNALKQALEKAPMDNGTFIIGLFGEWGIGKSTIIKNVKEDLEKKTEKKYKFIVYDAWKFVNDSFRRMFLLRLVDELGLEKEPFMDRFYSNLSEDKEINITYNSKKMRNYIVLPWAVWLVAVISLWLWGGRDNFVLQIINTIVSAFIPFFFSSLIRVFDELKTTKQTPLVFAAEQFTDCFSNILEETLRKNESENCRIVSWIKRGVRKIQGKTEILDKLVVVIDNIDRCSPDVAYELLTTVKTFFVNHNNLILIIPVDERALCEHMRDRFDRDSNRAAEFLRKIFNLEIRIKPLENVELYDFANRTNKDYNLGFSPDAIHIISREYASNPRRIIQFFNNARLEWEIVYQRIKTFSAEEIELAKNTMCKLLIIREEWPFYYEEIRQDPMKLLAGGFEIRHDVVNSDIALDAFLRATEFYPVIKDETKLSKVISNNRLFDNLPLSAIADLQTLDINKVAKFIKSSEENQVNTVKYLEKQIKNSIERKVIGNLTALFNFVLKINTAICGFSNQSNIILQTGFKKHVGEIISTMLKTAKVEDFCADLIKYINVANSQGRTYIFKEIMDGCILPNIKTPNNPSGYVITNTDKLYAELIKGVDDKKLFGKYKNTFSEWKSYVSDDVLDIKSIASSDVKYFITDNLQETLIKRISLGDNDETLGLDTAVYLLEHYNQDNGASVKLFDILNSIYPQYSIGQKSKSIKLVNSVLSVLKVLKPKNFSSNISTLILKLLSNKTYGYTLAINESYADKEEYIKVIDLLSRVLNYSLNLDIQSKMTSELNEFLKNSLKNLINRQADLWPEVLKALKSNITASHVDNTQLAVLVLGSGVYNNDYSLLTKSFVKWYYTGEEKDSPNYWCIKDSVLTAEIQRFLPVLRNGDEATKSILRDLLEYLVRERTNAVKAVAATLTDSAIIDNLPEALKVIVLENIYKNIESYANDSLMLKLVAKNADDTTIDTLVNNILLKQIVEPATKETALEIFDCIPKAKTKKYRRKINALKES